MRTKSMTGIAIEIYIIMWVAYMQQRNVLGHFNKYHI